MSDPTPEMYAELEQAYRHFNDALFGGELPPCLLTLQRKKNTMGYFSAERFVSQDRTITDEIALNPEAFAAHGLSEILQTIVHEMCHLWQHHFGSPGRGRYHNREWAEKMKAVGLMPSDTGEPGGKQTGDHVADYPIEGGPFELACDALLTKKFRVSWYDRFPSTMPEEESDLSDLLEVKPPSNGPKNASNRIKYRCRKCDAQAWGKPGLKLLCGVEECNQETLVPVV